MAKNAEEKTPTQEATIISKPEFKKLLKKLNAAEAEMAQAKGEMGSAVENAIAKHNVHKDALRIIRKFAKKSPAQASEFKAHLDMYWSHAELSNPEDDLVETPAERRKKMTKPEADEDSRLSQGTHAIRDGKVVPIGAGAA